MRVGYGFGRKEREFAGANVERVWIDHEGTKRIERSHMLRYGLRAGDTLVLLAKGDLGRGGEIPMIRSTLSEMNVETEVVEPEKGERDKPGPKPKYDPTPEQAEEIERLWKDTRWGGAYVIERITEILDWQGDERALRNALNYRYGGRTTQK